MKIVNEKGKLFGIINLIDFIVILIILGGVAGGTTKYLQGKGSEILSQQTDFTANILIRELYGDFYTYVKVGDIIYDPNTSKEIGEITSIDLSSARREVTNSNGQVVLSEVPNRTQIILTVKGKTKYSSTRGLFLGNDYKYIGTQITFKNDIIMITGNISGIQIEE